MKDRVIKVAIAGYGVMGEKYAKVLEHMPMVKLTAICTSNPLNIVLTEANSGVKLFKSYEDMLHLSDADVVCITVPTHLHKAFVMKAASCGKHIICEKPIALRLPDAQEMITACNTFGVRLFIGHVLRFFPEYQDLQKRITEGEIGAASVARTKRASAFPSEGSWLLEHSKSGGVIMDLMIHDIDFMRWIFGEVHTVYALNKAVEDMDYAAVTLRFKNGAIAYLEAFWGFPGPFTTEIEVVGNKGIIRHDNSLSRPITVGFLPDAFMRGVIIPEVAVGPDPFYLEITHFLDCLRHNKMPLVDMEDAYKAVEIAAAAMQSILTGMPVELNFIC